MFCDFRSLIIICPLLFLAGFVDSIGGGGGLISLPAFLLAGLSPYAALSSNKFSSTIGTSASVFRFVKEKFIKAEYLLFVPFALGGSAVGTRLSMMIDERIFQWVLLAVLPVTAFFILKQRTFEKAELIEPLKLDRHSAVPAVLVAFAVGAYDGFYGPGTGTFLIILLTGIASFDLKSAIGAGKLINFSSNLASLAVWLMHGKVLLPMAAIAAVFNMAGQIIGSRLVTRDGARVVRPIIFFVLCLLGGKVLWELLI